jgi:ribosomal-protein-alanine N-acetyltransferase
MMPIDLKVAGGCVRPFRRGDEPSLARYADNRKVWINLRDRFPHPYTLRDAEERIDWLLAQDPLTHFAIAVGDEVIGGIGFDLKEDIERRSAEIGFWLAEPFWGKGITTAAVRAVTEHAFATFDVCRLFGYVFSWNPGSMRVLEKAGYACEALLKRAATKDGKTIDVYLYALVKDRPAG